ncbi:MAG: hypothetical protein U9N61_04700 [Euryarchaeota archaeon]|nr:hypothetical protein [Euryarchaeota archaeon]
MRSASLLVLDVTDPDDVTLVILLPVGISRDEQNPDDRVAEPGGFSISPQGDRIAVCNEEDIPEDDEIVASTHASKR